MLEHLKFHHIGYAVNDILKTAEYYVRAGWALSEILLDEIQNTQIAFLTKEGFPSIELVAPINDKSPTVKILDKVGVTPYHICYETDDIEQSILTLKKQHFIPLFNPVEAVALKNRKICYLFNRHIGLIELVNND
jgi:methylmalonyl-CoA/ethylmalonyl-CoA epimerase